MVIRGWVGLGMAAAFCCGCGGRKPSDSPQTSGSQAISPLTIHFTRANPEAGFRFKHEDGSSGKKYFAEVMGPGCAFVDLTGDGKPDLYLVNGARLPGAPAGAPYKDAFYRNNGDGSFTDATDTSGLGDPRYGIGCSAGDFDNDGLLDLYVTNLERNTLYRNLGAGKFKDVTAASGVGAGGFSSGSAFGDYDRDGDLDLYVCRYVVWTPETNIVCKDNDGKEAINVYCRPTVYQPAKNLLYRNNGNGTFTDVTAASGADGNPAGRSLGCQWGDWDDDGDQDLFVANDMSANFFFINDGKGRFKEEALNRGVALGEGGRSHAGMGVGAADFDGDGLVDIQVTNFSGEYLAMYRNLGKGHFEDVSAQSGVAEATSPYVGFGVTLEDLDLDGTADLFVANGHVTEAAERFYPHVTLAQPNLLMLGDGEGGFTTIPDAGEPVTASRVHRGLATADYDGDGDLDLLVMNWKDEPDLLRNDSPAGQHWVRFRLRGKKSEGNVFGLGARVTIEAGGRKQVREIRSGGSYCSQSDLAATFGLDDAAKIEMIRVRWPRGGTSEWRNLAVDREHLLIQK